MRKTKIMFAIAAVAMAAPVSAITYVNQLAISGSATDLGLLGNGPNLNRLGGFGSDLVYDAATNQFYGLTDRGPGGGLIDYAPRIQSFGLSFDYNTGAISNFSLNATTILRDGTGMAYSGLNPFLLNNNPATLGLSLDPEGLARMPNGHYLISDEYGPSVLEFDANGNQVRAFTTPANLVPKKADGSTDYVAGRPTITSGRQDNRGFEGLTISADGKKAYAILQDPLVNEGDQGDGRRSRNVRIVVFDIATGTSTEQYVYQLESIAAINGFVPNNTFSATNQGRSIGVSSISALSDGRLIVLERDNRGEGVDDPNSKIPSGLKSAFVIDLKGATNVAGISLAGSNNLPNGVTPVTKAAFLDIRAKLLAAGIVIPEKIEGLAFGPRLANGSLALILATDNDYSVTQTGSGQQFDVCTSGAGGVSSQVALGTACPDGQSLITSRFFSFLLSNDEAVSLGFSSVPEPATWAMMIGGFGAVGSSMRYKRRRTKLRVI
ncbi:MAG: esterase-like activity of phytase family protein [Rhodocyclaceae bacterium]|nr:esterase-like activity of phytase family protein [Rhodocyclaceae bacterium]